jgi:hypothetical protein
MGTYFTVEDEGELAPARTVESENSGSMSLTWRGDPDVTHADWKIMVVTNELQTISYHVHKNVVCFGSRNSRYFARMLMNNQAKKMIKVDLDTVDAMNFPIILDYMYAPCTNPAILGTIPTAVSTLTSPSLFLSSTKSSEDDASYMVLGGEVNSNNAASLRFLAIKFEIDSFTLAVNKFIQKDLNFETAPRYLCLAKSYGDERLLESATRLCVENFASLDKNAISELPLDVFRNLVMSIQRISDGKQVERSWSLSEVVCRYMEKHPQYVSVALLLELTEPTLMPSMAADAALGFTAVIKTLSAEEITSHWDELAQFCRRCARSVVRDYGWHEFSVSGAIDEYLNQCVDPRLPVSQTESLLFATSLAAALDQAQIDYHEVTCEQANLQQMVENLNASLDFMEKIIERKDKYLSYQASSLDEAHQKIARLEQELAATRQQQRDSQPQSSLRTPPKSYHSMTPPPDSHQTTPSKVLKRSASNRSLSRSTTAASVDKYSSGGMSSPYDTATQYARPNNPQYYGRSLMDDLSSKESSSWGPRPQRNAPELPTKSLVDLMSMSRSQSTTGDSFSTAEGDPAIRDLISPTSIGTEVHRNKINKMKELRHKSGGNRGLCGSFGRR